LRTFPIGRSENTIEKIVTGKDFEKTRILPRLKIERKDFVQNQIDFEWKSEEEKKENGKKMERKCKIFHRQREGEDRRSGGGKLMRIEKIKWREMQLDSEIG
jgi:hypothetical protein